MINPPTSATRFGTNEDYEALEEAAGIKSPNHAFRHGIARAIQVWHNRPNELFSVRPAASQKAIRKISADAVRLLKDMSNPDVDEKEAWAYEYAVIELGLVGSGIEEKLRQLIETADILLVTAPIEYGRQPTDIPFEFLIEGLTRAYEDAKGRPPGVSHDRKRGPFFRLVKECRDRFKLNLRHQDDALGKAIDRYLEKRRRRLRPDKT